MSDTKIHLEYPFMHDGITYEEFEKELEYFKLHFEDFKKGTYIPLWKRKSEAEQ